MGVNYCSCAESDTYEKINLVDMRQENRAVVKIQALFRSYIARRKFRQLLQNARSELFNLTGDFYRGEFVLDRERFYIRSGKGVMQYENESVYEGQWEHGLKHGYGRLTNGEGDVYEGDWVADQAEGYGVFTNPEGYRYEGQWLNNSQQGLGMETWAQNNSKYIGNFKGSKKNGHGRYEWDDGSYYEGNFLNGLFEGKGSYYYADFKKTYIGEFKQGVMDGFGTETFKDGKVFMGSFKNGRKSGQGVMTYPNQKQYRGGWLMNMKHGIGIEINLRVNHQRMGEWRQGKWVRWISKTQRVDSAESLDNLYLHPYGSSQVNQSFRQSQNSNSQSLKSSKFQQSALNLSRNKKNDLMYESSANLTTSETERRGSHTQGKVKQGPSPCQGKLNTDEEIQNAGHSQISFLQRSLARSTYKQAQGQVSCKSDRTEKYGL